MTRTVLTLFLIGHVLGDFYLQPSELAASKEKSFFKLLKHSIIYLLSMVFAIIPIFDFTLLKWALFISIGHFVTDFTKYIIRNMTPASGRFDVFTYLLDQAVHIVLIVLSTAARHLLLQPTNYIPCIQSILTMQTIDVSSILSHILIILIVILPFSITIRKILWIYRPVTEEQDEGYPNAGAFIGVLERCIILSLLSVGQYSAIGFVLTAKSIARYNKIVEDPKFSEYYLLGTLLSTMLTIITFRLIL